MHTRTTSRVMPSLGTPEHTLITLLSLGLWVEIISSGEYSPNSFTSAIKRLRTKGWVIRERVVQGPGRHFNSPVYSLEGVRDAEVRDKDGNVLVVTLNDETSRAAAKRT